MICQYPNCGSSQVKSYEAFDRKEPSNGKKESLVLCQGHYDVMKPSYTKKNWTLKRK